MASRNAWSKWMLGGGVAVVVSVMCVGVQGAGKSKGVPGVPGVGVPFKGSSENQAISAEPIAGEPNYLFITTLGEGNATHLGRFTFVSPHRAGLVDFSVDGAQIFTAANGDELHAKLFGFLTPVPVEGGLLLVGDVPGRIEGGTGRFANATGSFTFSVVFDTADQSSVAEIDGTIHYAGK